MVTMADDRATAELLGNSFRRLTKPAAAYHALRDTIDFIRFVDHLGLFGVLVQALRRVVIGADADVQCPHIASSSIMVMLLGRTKACGSLPRWLALKLGTTG